MAFGTMRLPAVTFGLFRTFSVYPFFGLFVDTLVGCGEDFGKVGEVELFDEGEGDCAFVALRPSFERTNKCLNHEKIFILEIRAALDPDVCESLFAELQHGTDRREQTHNKRPCVRWLRLASESVTQPPRFHLAQPLANARSREPKGREK